MKCVSPLTGYRHPDGKVRLTVKGAFYDKPVTITCGQCIGCRLEHSRQWAVRCTHEAHMHPENSFLTLTYSDDNLPPDRGIHVSHWQTFAKRLRKKIGPLRFFHCGEYGDDTFRPHYHALLFGHDFAASRSCVGRSGPHDLYSSTILDDAWGLGHATIGSYSFQSAAYVARYTLKKIKGEYDPEVYRIPEHLQPVNEQTGELTTHRKKPYTTMSRRPGIGRSFYDKYKKSIYAYDSVCINGRLMQPPKYYDLLYEVEEPEHMKRIRRKRKQKALLTTDDNSYERMRVKEEAAFLQEARISRDF